MVLIKQWPDKILISLKCYLSLIKKFPKNGVRLKVWNLSNYTHLLQFINYIDLFELKNWGFLMLQSIVIKLGFIC